MGEVRQLFEARGAERAAGALTDCEARAIALAEAWDVADFVRRVRLPGSGAVMRLFGLWEAWEARRVESKAQDAFEAPLRWGWC